MLCYDRIDNDSSDDDRSVMLIVNEDRTHGNDDSSDDNDDNSDNYNDNSDGNDDRSDDDASNTILTEDPSQWMRKIPESNTRPTRRNCSRQT